MYDGGRGSDRPRTLIFRVLRWHDRSEILKGARQAYPVKCAQDNVTLLFFPDQKAEDFISSLSQQKTYAAALWEGNGKTAATISPARRERLDGRDGGGPSCPGRDGHGCLLNLFFIFLLFSLLLGYCPYLSDVKCTSAFTCYLQNGSASAFFHLLNTILGL